MKLVALLLLFRAFNSFGQADTLYLEFAESDKADDNCEIIYAVNGSYIVEPTSFKKNLVKGSIYVNPAVLAYQDTLRTSGNNSFARTKDKFSYDRIYYVPLTPQEVDKLLRENREPDVAHQNKAKILKKLGISKQAISQEQRNRLKQKMANQQIAKAKAKDSIERLRRRRLLLPQLPKFNPDSVKITYINIPSYAYTQEVNYEEMHKAEIDSVYQVYDTLRKTYSSAVKEIHYPFFISKTEVTNEEYQEFLGYIRDSVYLHTAYFYIESDSMALTLLNCSKKQKDSLNSSERFLNLAKYGLKNSYKTTADLADNDEWKSALSSLYYKGGEEQRYYRRTFKNEYFQYAGKDGVKTLVYPDTTAFWDLESFNEMTGNMYNWHPAFKDKPVLCLSYKQMNAYINWREKQLRSHYKKKGYNLELSLPSIADYEFAMKSLLPVELNSIVQDRSNDNFVVDELEGENLDNRISKVKTKFFERIFKKPVLTVDSYQYELWKNDNETGDLLYINGNASEICSTPITKELLEYYQMTIPEGNLEDYNLVLGSNFKTDVLIKGSIQHNKIFYKQLTLKTKGSAQQGFRLKYTLTPIAE